MRDAEIQSAAYEREAILKDQAAIRLQEQIHDLQGLLAAREREHLLVTTTHTYACTHAHVNIP